MGKGDEEGVCQRYARQGDADDHDREYHNII